MTENYQDMMTKLPKTICAIAFLGFAFTSCEIPKVEKVDTLSNVYKELSTTTNGQVDSLVNGVLAIEELKDFDNALKVVSVTLEDEMQAIRALMNVAIDEITSPVPLALDNKNTLFLHSKNNMTASSFAQRDTTQFKTGYKLVFANKGENYDELRTLWKQVGNKYEPMFKNDSITQKIKDRIEASFIGNLKTLQDIEYVVLIDDVLLIPPVIDYEQEGYSSGYVVSHVYTYEVETFEKVEQMMVIASNGDQIEYRTYSDKVSANTTIINKKLREDLLSERTRVMDSIFDF
ncbi:hypothetical protein [uncultured Kordia sp.]|uniref:hypothetical protein n=1 Tax=uncultured Kordia sp. TaxID=507699 RepID=UPI00260B8A72|nr:hypothetical protein [uncultured Kordia sp.]